MPLSALAAGELPEWSWLDWLGPYLVHVVLLFALRAADLPDDRAAGGDLRLPRMMAIVAARDYPDLSRYGSASAAFWGSLGNTVVAGAIFVVGWLLTLPLLLIPGVLLVLPLLWTRLAQPAHLPLRRAGRACDAHRSAPCCSDSSRSDFWLAGLVSALRRMCRSSTAGAGLRCAVVRRIWGLSALRGCGSEGGRMAVRDGMGFGALIIGDEIIRGKREDKHFAKLRELLAARGLTSDWVLYLGDDRPRLIETLRRTLAGSDVVFSFGGIGVTPDDHTRQAAAAAAGVPLVLHPEAEARDPRAHGRDSARK